MGMTQYQFPPELKEIRIYAESQAELEEGLRAIPRDSCITRIYISAHGAVNTGGDAVAVAFGSDLTLLFTEAMLTNFTRVHPLTGEQISQPLSKKMFAITPGFEQPHFLLQTKSLSNPFRFIHDLVSDDVKIFLSTCLLFAGDADQISVRADMIRRLFAPLSNNPVLFGFSDISPTAPGLHNGALYSMFYKNLKSIRWDRLSEEQQRLSKRLRIHGYRIDANNQIHDILVPVAFFEEVIR